MEKASLAEWTLRGISFRGTENGQCSVADKAGLRESADKTAEASRDNSLQSLVDHIKNFNVFSKSNGEWLED